MAAAVDCLPGMATGRQTCWQQIGTCRFPKVPKLQASGARLPAGLGLLRLIPASARSPKTQTKGGTFHCWCAGTGVGRAPFPPPKLTTQHQSLVCHMTCCKAFGASHDVSQQLMNTFVSRFFPNPALLLLLQPQSPPAPVPPQHKHQLVPYRRACGANTRSRREEASAAEADTSGWPPPGSGRSALNCRRCQCRAASSSASASPYSRNRAPMPELDVPVPPPPLTLPPGTSQGASDAEPASAGVRPRLTGWAPWPGPKLQSSVPSGWVEAATATLPPISDSSLRPRACGPGTSSSRCPVLWPGLRRRRPRPRPGPPRGRARPFGREPPGPPRSLPEDLGGDREPLVMVPEVLDDTAEGVLWQARADNACP